MEHLEIYEKAKQYAKRVLEEYKILYELDAYGYDGKDCLEYISHFTQLKEVLSCERDFYGLLDSSSLQFIILSLQLLNNSFYNFSCVDTLFDVADMEEAELLEIRVFDKALMEGKKRKMGTLPYSKNQLGLIPLVSKQPDSIFDVCMGCFNTEFSYAIFSNSQYPDILKKQFLYSFSYVNSSIELYYLNTVFSMNLEDAQNASDFIASRYIADDGKYGIGCSKLYTNVIEDVLNNLFSFAEEDLIKDPSCAFSISIFRDAVYSFFKIIPYDQADTLLKEILQQGQNPFIMNYLYEKVQPLLLEQKRKAKRFGR